jgi:hypothetical protein
MKLQDCNLNPAAVVMAPFVRSDPEAEWVTARDQGRIPSSLFDLYRRAGYLSFGSAPQFLKDDEGILYSYFALIVRSLMASLLDASEYIHELEELKTREYYPGKNNDDPTWTPEKSNKAAKSSYDAFRNSLASLCASLDSLAEMIAIFSQGHIKNLHVGRAQFSRIEERLNEPQIEHLLDKVHAALYPLIYCDDPEAEWLSYMRMLRNKTSHLGPALFRTTVLRGQDGQFYKFVPREWPYLWEKYMKPEGIQPAMPMSELLKKTLAHQDIVDYSCGALKKVTGVIEDVLCLIGPAYTEFSDFGPNTIALNELTKNSKTFAFEHFK